MLVAIAGVSTLLLILLSYYLINGRENVSQIALPDYTVIPSDEPRQESGTPFAAVNRENVLQVLANLQPLEAYHCTMTVEYYWDDGSSTQTVELWNRGSAQYLMDSGSNGERHVLIREDGAWIWYEDSEPTAMPEKAPSVTALLGVPDYMELSKNAIVAEAEYSALAGDDQISCIYVQWVTAENRSVSCWISPATGLLERAIVVENGKMIYRMQQSLSERLLPGDDAYSTQFLLPGEAR